MADINFNNLTKKQLQLFLTGYCRHRHKYCEHPNCFLTEQGLNPKLGFLDIETSNLKANFGVMYSYAIKDGESKTIYGRTITKEEIESETMDKQLVQDCIDDIYRFDKILTYYGTRFDVPFIRSRALYWGIAFPEYATVNHKDVYYMARSKLCIHSNRLEVATRFLGIKGKTHIENEYWIRAMQGDEKSLEYIWVHNKKDVEILQRLYERLKNFTKDTNRSI